jgi:DNA-binding LacI/PurR family transcriptional regulator
MYVDADTLLHPYLQLALNGIFNSAHQLEHDVLVYTAHDHNQQKAVVEDLLDSRADGLIFISPRAQLPAAVTVAESGVPYAVLFEGSVGNSFTVDNDRGVNMALEHLLSLGHRRIAHLAGDLSLTDGQVRAEAYRKFMQERVPAVNEHVVLAGDFTRKSGFAAARWIAQSELRPTAVFCGNDDLAFGLMEALPTFGIRCPEDMSVVGLDCVFAIETSSPALTTVCQKPQLMAFEAVRALIQCIETGAEIVSRTFEPDFLVRSSTAPVPQEELR